MHHLLGTADSIKVALRHWELRIGKVLFGVHSSKSQGSHIRQISLILRQNCSDDSTEVTEGVTSTPEIFGNTVLSLPFSQQIQFKRCKP